MKLIEIVVQEAEAPTTGDKKYELKDVMEFFPNTFQKAMKTLCKAGRLTWNGDLVFTKSGDYGPALDKAVAAATSFMEDQNNTVEISFDIDGSVGGIDNGGDYHGEYSLDENQEVYVGYNTKSDKIIVGFDVWLYEEVFNQEFDKQFKKIFGMNFDNDNSDHEKIFNGVHDEWKKAAFQGVQVEVTSTGACELDIANEGGFYKGIFRNKSFSRKYIADFRLD